MFARRYMPRTFSEFAAHFNALVDRFGHGPPRISVKNWMTFRQQTVVLSKEVFADQLRHALYGSQRSAYIPYIVERAYRYDYAPLAELIEAEARSTYLNTAMGLNLSVTCRGYPFHYRIADCTHQRRLI